MYLLENYMQTSFTINTSILTFHSKSQLNWQLVGGWASMAAHPHWWTRGNPDCVATIILDQVIKTCRCRFHQSRITNRRRWFSQTKGSLSSFQWFRAQESVDLGELPCLSQSEIFFLVASARIRRLWSEECVAFNRSNNWGFFWHTYQTNN